MPVTEPEMVPRLLTVAPSTVASTPLPWPSCGKPEPFSWISAVVMASEPLVMVPLSFSTTPLSEIWAPARMVPRFITVLAVWAAPVLPSLLTTMPLDPAITVAVVSPTWPLLTEPPFCNEMPVKLEAMVPSL